MDKRSTEADSPSAVTVTLPALPLERTLFTEPKATGPTRRPWPRTDQLRGTSPLAETTAKLVRSAGKAPCGAERWKGETGRESLARF